MIIVTGASKGIGLAIAERLFSNGEEVLGLSRNPGNQIFETRSLDVTDFADLKRISDEIRLNGRKVSAVINVAGIASMNIALMANPFVSEKLVKVNVNCIAPGPIATDLLRGVSQDQIREIVNAQIFKMQFQVQDVVDIVDLLLDSKAKSLTGQTFHIGGIR